VEAPNPIVMLTDSELFADEKSKEEVKIEVNPELVYKKQ
jgi:hypothetical protein